MEAGEPNKLLVVRVGAMGDVLHGLPAVSALRARRPEVEVGWVVDRRWAPLVTGVADHIHVVDTPSWKRSPLSRQTFAALRTLRSELLQKQYDVCVDLQGTIRSAAISRMSGAARLVGPAQPRESLARAAYSHAVRTRANSVIRQACELVSEAVGERLAPVPVTICPEAEAETWAADTAPAEPFALLVPRAGWGAKQWPAAHFAELVWRLRRQGMPALINAAGENDSLAAEIAAAAPGERVVCSVAQLVALTRRAALVVGGDTGPMHLAALLGRPTVALFGPTDPERNGPEFAGARVRVLQHPASARTYKRTADVDAGLAQISCDEVLLAAGDLLKGNDG